jgi:hypothetical protein
MRIVPVHHCERVAMPSPSLVAGRSIQSTPVVSERVPVARFAVSPNTTRSTPSSSATPLMPLRVKFAMVLRSPQNERSPMNTSAPMSRRRSTSQRITSGLVEYGKGSPELVFTLRYTRCPRWMRERPMVCSIASSTARRWSSS